MSFARILNLPAAKIAASALFLALLPGLVAPAAAHSRWIVPSHTVLSGDGEQTVTFDVSVSNDIFHPDRPFGGPSMRRGPLSEARVEVTRPDGTVDDSASLIHLGRKSVFDVALAQDGTYQVEVDTPEILLTTWNKPGGERGGRAFGARSEVADRIPADAVDVSTRRILTRIVTWVTRNAPTEPKPTGEGLELTGVHPSDLFTGEPLKFRLLVDGRPAPAGTAVELVRAGTRHRNDREVVSAETGEDGSFEVLLDQAGLYLLETDVEISAEGLDDIDHQSYSLFATLEVQPQ